MSTDAPVKRGPGRPPKSSYAASEATVGQDSAKFVPTEGEARIESESGIEVIDRPLGNDKMAELAFMEEFVDVIVHKTGDKTAEPIFTVWNGGRPQLFVRGIKQTVRRKYVEVLSRARVTGYEQEVYVDKSTHDAVNRLNPNTALRYPFDVVRDPNPRGPDWLRNLLLEA